MNTKITLKLNRTIVEQARKYASAHNTSLSKLIETYLEQLPLSNESEEVSPNVKSLLGVISLPKNYDEKKMYRKYILKKYGM
jgi:hypothetical protein